MTPERARELLPVIQAFAEGKRVQSRRNDCADEWKCCDTPIWHNYFDYRVEPEPREGWVSLSALWSNESAAKRYTKSDAAIIKVREVL